MIFQTYTGGKNEMDSYSLLTQLLHLLGLQNCSYTSPITRTNLQSVAWETGTEKLNGLLLGHKVID